MRIQYIAITVSFLLFLFSSCTEDSNQTVAPKTGQKTTINAGSGSFKRVLPKESGISFTNLIKEDYDYNIFNYEYLYNGGGVAVGDINNDGLPDLYFTATFSENKLYLNKGNFQFEDITLKAGVGATVGFKTGVTMADINNDGYLDIYVCRTSKTDDGKKNNHVFINNKDLTFTDRGAEMGLLDNMNSNHATFFDYDLDGDLDLYLLNHRLDFTLAVKVDLEQDALGNLKRKTEPISPFESDKLYRNDGNGKFYDVSLQAGINNSAFGLSATVADLNEDGYPDIYVANDYIEPDYVYINNKKGGFVDQYSSRIRHSSQNSMGADIADINNDGLPDIIVMDMIAEDPIRYKELMNVMQTKRYNTLVKYGYGHQVGRNVLQLNNGRGGFSEIGQIAGISNTDWSWGPLMVDLDNDGWKDIFIANGYRRDVTNLDYMNYTRDSIAKTGGITPKRFPSISEFMNIVPEKKIANYCFRNNGGWTFDNVGDAWGFGETTFSNGAAYGDLDADGDIDIIVNNIGDPAYIYQNNSANANYLQLEVTGPKKNNKGYGCEAILTTSDGIQTQSLQASRGFFSASEPLMHFGLGNSTIEKLEIIWPGGNYQVINNPKPNQRLKVNYSNSKKGGPTKASSANLVAQNKKSGLNFKHKENLFEDFDRERLLPSQLSKLGPHLAIADISGDGHQDIFVGGAVGQAGTFYTQNAAGTFKEKKSAVLNSDMATEDMGAVFFDADQDGDQDLYVVSGGAAMRVGNPAYQDRLYINDGKGNFSKSKSLPKVNAAGSQAVAMDYDSDGDQDLFIGARCLPGSYPTTPKSSLLQNDGKGNFVDVSEKDGKSITNLGMISDVVAVDLDGDKKMEIIIAGEWLPIGIYSWDGKNFIDKSSAFGMTDTEGWWNTIVPGDVDGDGDIDFIAGNLGTNTRLKTAPDQPLLMFAKDFDRNGQVDPIMAFTKNGKDYPFAGRDMMVSQLSFVKKNYPRYSKYAKATVTDIFGEKAVSEANKLEAKEFKSKLFLNDGAGNFKAVDLPIEAQISPIMAAQIYNFDGKPGSEIFLSGNFSGAETETGVYDGFNGLILRYQNDNWQVIEGKDSGFWIPGEGRSMEILNRGKSNPMILATQNNGEVLVFERAK